MDAVDETGDPQLSAPYASDIYSYLRSLEVRVVLPRSHRFNQFPRSAQGSDELRDCVIGPGETAAGGGLHREGAGGHHPQYAQHPRRLARRGRRGVQARLRHALPHRLLN